MLTALNASGLAIALTLLALLAARRQRLAGDPWLYVWIGANILLFAGMMLATNTQGIIAIAGTVSVQLAVSAMAPALYLFGWTITTGTVPARRLWLALSPILLVLAFLASLTMLPTEISDGEIRVLAPSPAIAILPLMTLLFNAGFPVLTLRRLRTYRIGLGRAPSKALVSDLRWTRLWALAHVALLSILLGGFLLTLGGVLSGSLQLAMVLAAQTGLMAYVGYHGLTRSHVFFASDRAGWRAVRVSDERQQARSDFEAVTGCLTALEVHTDPELTSARFAERMGWGQDRLNEAIRAGGSTSFSALLTKVRVATVKRWMREPAYQTTAVLRLGLDAGFKSKTAFYDGFKSVEGVSPGAWKRNQVAL